MVSASYTILPYTRRQAKKYHVYIQPSTRKYKKIDVFKDRQKKEKLASVGDVRYMDYPNWIRTRGRSYASKRRQL